MSTSARIAVYQSVRRARTEWSMTSQNGRLLLLAPHLRQPVLRHLRHVAAIVRRVVEQRQTRIGDVFEIEDVEGAGTLIETIAILARIESDERAEKQPDSGLVRDH